MQKLVFNPPVLAHRGACGYAPENTIAAFQRAVDLKINWVEFDVMLTQDGEAVVFHDELLDRTTNANGLLSMYPFAYLKTLDAGSWFNPAFAGEKIPTLETVLTFLIAHKISANIEIKPLPGEEVATVEKILAVVAALPQHQSTFLYSSFSIESLQYLHKLAPQTLKGLLLHEWLPDWEIIARDLNCVAIHVFADILTAENVAYIKQAGWQLLSYTVNDPQHAALLYKWGVDAVFSDVPDLIANISSI